MKIAALLLFPAAASMSAAHAQGQGPAERLPEFTDCRFYAGLAASAQVYQVVSPRGGINYITSVGIYPLYVYGGYQLSPHLAVQVGFSQRTPDELNYEDSRVLPDGRRYEAYDRQSGYDAAVPVLLHYRLTRKVTRRFHVDALLGGTVQFHRYRREIQEKIDGQITSTYVEDDRNRGAHFTGGLAIGLTFHRRFDLLAEAGVNVNLATFRNDPVRIFHPTMAGGLRYGFGRIK